MDIDWIEFRDGKPVAFLEVSRVHDEYLEWETQRSIDNAYRFTLYYVLKRLRFQIAMLQAYSRLLSAKVFVVISDADLRRFLVLDLAQISTPLKLGPRYPLGIESLSFKMMNRSDYEGFLRSL